MSWEVVGCLATLGAPEPGLGGAGPADMVDLLERRVCRMENSESCKCFARVAPCQGGTIGGCIVFASDVSIGLGGTLKGLYR